MSSIFRAPGTPEIERRLESRVLSRLSQLRALENSLDGLWERTLGSRGKEIPLGHRARLWVLHRQFRGAPIPGLRHAVGVARGLWNRLQTWRQ